MMTALQKWVLTRSSRNNDHSKHSNDIDIEKVSLTQLQECLHSIVHVEGNVSRFTRFGRLMWAMRYFGGLDFLINTVLYIVAGLLLTVAILIPESVVPYYPHRANMDMTASLLYILCSGSYVAISPIKEYRSKLHSERCIELLRKEMRKRAGGESGKDRYCENSISSFVHNNLFENHPHLSLTKLDLEAFLFEVLGSRYSDRVADDLLREIDLNGDGKISCEEMHCFICADDRRSLDHLKLFMSSIYHSFITPMVLFSLSFMLGSVVSVMKNILLRRNDFDLVWLVGNRNPSLLSGWLFLLGCTFFVFNACSTIKASYINETRAKRLLRIRINYAPYYKADSKFWSEFYSKAAFSKTDFRDLLWHSSIEMSEDEAIACFDLIDTDNDGMITKVELEEFLNVTNKENITILNTCFRNWNVYAQLFWFIGTFGYLLPGYQGVKYHTGYGMLGGIGYLLGGLSCIGISLQMISNTKKRLEKFAQVVLKAMENENEIQLHDPRIRFIPPL
ncbi:predicted protein [Chaetoceros tenuissimus]|uniref:EF-hand domain-containing protein n=1 Tax=Chaetoceros tenuissimus TaxID=426638 RepID=A0AAD3CQL2_9STRA|nr:predicted protein [Chaetoceros tenuissimus]